MADDRRSELEELLKHQRDAFTASRPEAMSLRKDRIRRAMALLKENDEELCRAMGADFGNRAIEQSMITDIAGTVGLGKDALKHMDSWAKTDKRKVQFPLNLLGAKAEVRYEPKGVIGILSPWNFPVNLAFAPLMQVLAAGNRAMIKPSEFTERTSELMAELTGGRRGLFLAAFRPSRFHRLDRDRSARHAVGGEESRARDARTGRQVARHHGAKRRFRESGRADRIGQDDECRPDLPCARLHVCPRRQGRRGGRGRFERRVRDVSDPARE